MKMKKLFAKFSLLVFMSAAAFPVPLGAEDAPQLLPLPNPQAIYVLSEHLSDADAAVYVDNKETRKGTWEDESFSFYGIGKEGNVQVISESADNQNWQSIQMNALRGSNRLLQFPNAPSGGGMVFYYKTALDKPSKQNVYIYVIINAGNKQVARFRVTANQEGWQRIWVPFGILRLFSRTFPLSVVILGDKVYQPSFNFYAEIYQ